jgi:hypothetical protein
MEFISFYFCCVTSTNDLILHFTNWLPQDKVIIKPQKGSNFNDNYGIDNHHYHSNLFILSIIGTAISMLLLVLL